MALFHTLGETTLVEVSVGELVAAFESYGSTDPLVSAFARAQVDTARLLDALGAPEPGRVLVAPWRREEES